MSSPKIKTVSPLEAWCLERAAGGYALAPAHLRKCSQAVQGLIAWAAQINPKDRRKTIIDSLDKEAREQLTRIDPDSPPPTAAERTYEIVPASRLGEIPPLQWLIDREIPRQGVSILYGESGVGKSFLALDYALRVAQSDGVLYIPSEGEAGYRKRVAAWCQHNRQTEGALSFLFGAFSLIDAGALDTLQIDLGHYKPALVIVDTLAMSMVGGDENSSRDMGMVMASCRAMARMSGCAVLLVHHVGRSGQHERGSTALRGNADTMIRVAQADDLIAVECAKTKDEAPFPTRYMRLIEVEVQGTGKSLVPIGAELVIRTKADPLTPRQYSVLDALSLESMADGASIRDIADHIGLAVSTTHRVVSNLIKLGYVVKMGQYTITDEGMRKIGRESVPGVPLGVPLSTVPKQGNSSLSVPGVPGVPGVPVFQRNAKKNSRGTGGTGGTVEHHGKNQHFQSGTPVEQQWNSGTLDLEGLEETFGKTYYSEGY